LFPGRLVEEILEKIHLMEIENIVLLSLDSTGQDNGKGKNST